MVKEHLEVFARVKPCNRSAEVYDIFHIVFPPSQSPMTQSTSKQLAISFLTPKISIILPLIGFLRMQVRMRSSREWRVL